MPTFLLNLFTPAANQAAGAILITQPAVRPPPHCAPLRTPARPGEEWNQRGHLRCTLSPASAPNCLPPVNPFGGYSIGWVVTARLIEGYNEEIMRKTFSKRLLHRGATGMASSTGVIACHS